MFFVDSYISCSFYLSGGPVFSSIYGMQIALPQSIDPPSHSCTYAYTILCIRRTLTRTQSCTYSTLFFLLYLIIFFLYLHQPGGTSTRNMVHWAQLVRSGEFRAFDFGKDSLNIVAHGQKEPPLVRLYMYTHTPPSRSLTHTHTLTHTREFRACDFGKDALNVAAHGQQEPPLVCL